MKKFLKASLLVLPFLLAVTQSHVSSKPLYQHNDKVLIRLDCAVHALRFNEEQSTAITTMMKMFTRIP